MVEQPEDQALSASQEQEGLKVWKVAEILPVFEMVELRELRVVALTVR